jgi:hypothetical protein
LGLEDGKKRFINEVTALSKAFAIAIPHEQAMDVKEEVAFISINDLLLTRFFLERDFNSSLSSFFNTSKATFLCFMPLSSSKNSSDRMEISGFLVCFLYRRCE